MKAYWMNADKPSSWIEAEVCGIFLFIITLCPSLVVRGCQDLPESQKFLLDATSYLFPIGAF